MRDRTTLERRLLDRRQVLLGLGGGGFAVALLGVAGCSATSSPGGTPSPSTTGALSYDRVDLGFVSAYVLVRGGEAAVVDTGVSGSADAIGAVLDTAGPGWAGVRHVVLTHKHPDHVGSLSEVLARATSATGYVGAADLDAVTSPRPLRPLDDGDEVLGLTVVATPGHTPGHICVFDPGTGILVAGDALNNRDGLAGSDPQFTADPAAAEASVRTLAALPVRTILFGHGEPLTTDAAAALRRLAG